jgi:hypothetical protein
MSKKRFELLHYAGLLFAVLMLEVMSIIFVMLK